MDQPEKFDFENPKKFVKANLAYVPLCFDEKKLILKMYPKNS